MPSYNKLSWDQRTVGRTYSKVLRLFLDTMPIRGRFGVAGRKDYHWDGKDRKEENAQDRKNSHVWEASSWIMPPEIVLYL